MLRIRPLHENDKPAVLAICDLQLGKNYVTEVELSNYSVLVAESELGVCVGVCLYCLEGDKNAGCVKTVAVLPEYCGMGVGTKLVAHAVESLRSCGVAEIFSPLWKHDGVINSEKIFTRNGFLPDKEIPDFWLEDSRKRNFSCPVCGEICHCSAVIFKMECK
ncbi:MAG: GNAT family N-acetyltransferase [Bacteroidales bacterium]|nr:GNAT family N-acetyltransferase [Bacteroidales bacterium]